MEDVQTVPATQLFDDTGTDLPGEILPGEPRYTPNEWVGYAFIACVAVLGSLFYYLAELRVAGRAGFPLDDSWIHLQFARNLAAGHGLSFNPGTPSAGSTAPLWTLILSIPTWLGADPVIAAKAVGTCFTIAAAIAAGALVHYLTASRFAASVAGVAVALTPRLTWGSVSGMEVPLYAALGTLTLLAYLRAQANRSVRWALLAGLAGTARPETFVLFPILLVHWALWGPVRAGEVRMWRRVAVPAAAFSAVVLPYVLLNLYGGGRPLPTTFYAKSEGLGLLNGVLDGNASEIWRGLASYPLSTVNFWLRWCYDQSALLYMPLLVGALALSGVVGRAGRRGGAVLVAVFLLAPAAVGAIAPKPPFLVHDGRYVAHLLVLFFVIAAIGLAELDRRARPKWVVRAFAVLALARLLSQNVKYAERYGPMVENINIMQVEMGRWVRDHTGPDAIIATNDIGAIGYFSGRQVIDTEGLVTPAIIPFKRQRTHLAFLSQAKPDLLIIFPNWYPDLASRTDLFQPVHEITVEQRVISGGKTFVAYRTPWTRPERFILSSGEQ